MCKGLKRDGLLILAAIALFVFSGVSPVAAHDFWLNVSSPQTGKIVAEIGYGHDFPKPEPIASDRLHIFESPRLLTPDRVIEFKPKGENYAYEGNGTLQKGSYIGTGLYRPTFWSKGPGGWKQQNFIDRPDATYAKQTTMYTKTIVTVGGYAGDDFITRPVGHRLEIVPLVDPATVRAGEILPLQVLFDGKPLKTVAVAGTFGGFSKKDYKAFFGKTDLEGKIDFVPLRSGAWFINTKHEFPHADQAKAKDVSLKATLTFRIES